MRAIVYYPKSENAQKKLSKRVSEVHAEFVLDYIKHLELSKEQSEKVIAEIAPKILKAKHNKKHIGNITDRSE